MHKKAVIFDLDGVIVSTDECHYRAWKKMADMEGIYFDRKINEKLRGVSRMDCLEIILKNTGQRYSTAEKAELARRKNDFYRQQLSRITPKDILPGVLNILKELKRRGIKTAIGSSSKNAPLILKRIGLENTFDTSADGNEIKKSKPDPEVFLLVAQKLGVHPGECVVVEDAEAGIQAALAGGMKAIGIGSASRCPNVHYGTANLSLLTVEELLRA